MMEHNDELYLKQKVGNRNPFRVPEGYFEQLTEQVMNNLPEVEGPWLYAAACSILALAMGVSYYFMQSQSTSADAVHMAAVTPVPSASTSDVQDNSYYDDAADYAMLDNAEIYAYLSENY